MGASVFFFFLFMHLPYYSPLLPHPLFFSSSSSKQMTKYHVEIIMCESAALLNCIFFVFRRLRGLVYRIKRSLPWAKAIMENNTVTADMDLFLFPASCGDPSAFSTINPHACHFLCLRCSCVFPERSALHVASPLPSCRLTHFPL